MVFRLCQPAIAQSPRAAVLAAGTEDGTYTLFSHCLSDLLAKDNISLQIVSTGGSVENIKLLDSGKADFALAQSDVASAAIAGGFPFANPASHVRLVSSVYTEVVHVRAARSARRDRRMVFLRHRRRVSYSCSRSLRSLHPHIQPTERQDHFLGTTRQRNG